MKNINEYLDDLNKHVMSAVLNHPNQILEELNSFKDYGQLLLIVKNSSKAINYINGACNSLLNNKKEDIWLTCLFLILVHSHRIEDALVLSRLLSTNDITPWAKFMAISFLLNRKELNDKKLCITA
jgi:hypothetical protein